jgi:hypothetical protein
MVIDFQSAWYLPAIAPKIYRTEYQYRQGNDGSQELH